MRNNQKYIRYKLLVSHNWSKTKVKYDATSYHGALQFIQSKLMDNMLYDKHFTIQAKENTYIYHNLDNNKIDIFTIVKLPKPKIILLGRKETLFSKVIID